MTKKERTEETLYQIWVLFWYFVLFGWLTFWVAMKFDKTESRENE